MRRTGYFMSFELASREPGMIAERLKFWSRIKCSVQRSYRQQVSLLKNSKSLEFEKTPDLNLDKGITHAGITRFKT